MLPHPHTSPHSTAAGSGSRRSGLRSSAAAFVSHMALRPPAPAAAAARSTFRQRSGTTRMPEAAKARSNSGLLHEHVRVCV